VTSKAHTRVVPPKLISVLNVGDSSAEIFDPTIDLHGLLAEHVTHPEWGVYTRGKCICISISLLMLSHARFSSAGLLENAKFELPTRGAKHDQAHPPIHPLRSALRDDFSVSRAS
jgi:hypothetical protein